MNPSERASSDETPHPKDKHLRRLHDIFSRQPVYFVTTCVQNRAHRLANPESHAICREVWEFGQSLHRWSVGSYVILPDHVHFFCRPGMESAVSLSRFVGGWKEWTAKYLARRHGFAMPLWQPEFFDHILRSEESLDQKWQYTRRNPVRHGYVTDPDQWEYQGMISDWW